MNELTKQQTNAIDTINQTSNIEGNELSKLGIDFCPRLDIAASTSDSVRSGVASLGDFVLNKNVNLGKEIEVVPLAYRLHAALINTEENEFLENKYVLMGQKPTEEYRNFCIMTPPKDCVIKKGSDIYIYIPKINNFGQIWLKATTAVYSDPIWQAGKGGRLVKLHTYPMENKKKTRFWFGIKILETKQSLEISKLSGYSKDIPMDIDIYMKYLNQFNNPQQSNTEIVEENKEDTIER